MNKETKLRIHNITAKAALNLGSEAWVLKKREEQRLEAAQMKFLRHLLRITKLDKEKNRRPLTCLRSWVRIPLGAWIFVCCDCRVLSGTGLCDELITRPEESYRLCCVVVCDLETSRIGASYIYDISSLGVNNLTLILLTWRKW